MNTAKKAAVVLAATGAALGATVGVASANSGAEGVAAHSPGAISGNVVQVPIHVPVNLCGNTVNVIAAANMAIGNTCGNNSSTSEKTNVAKKH
ncbi:chaplin [Streptomyces pathocidini]|uniref:Chaplin n=1 Tax=Streptomyces pathocidini TaxID=1650571 RepID=A0ABW7V0H2_9ACTN|nr:chaplin [Streptomyces pathocidini]